MSANDSMAVDWEQSKENFQPLKAGRKPDGLSDPLNIATGGSIDEQKQKYIDLIKNYKGDDPIEVWLCYIKWTQETFKAGGHKSELLPLLEQCTRQLQSLDRYKTDIRYLRLWIQYADCLPDPSDVFSFLKENDIGQEHTLFYVAHATFLELRGAYSTADNVYQQGINRMAQPLHILRGKFNDFQHRMARRIQRRAQEQAYASNDLADSSMNHPERHSLAVLGGRRAGGGDRGVGLASQKRKAVATPGRDNAPAAGGLEIFVDEEFGGSSAANYAGSGDVSGSDATSRGNNASNDPPGRVWNSLPTYEQTRKENVQKASTWAGQRMKQQSLYTPSNAPALDIPLDPEFAHVEPEPGTTLAAAEGGTSLRQRLDRRNDEELAHDPLRWHKAQAGQTMPPPPMPRPSALACDVTMLNIGGDDGHSHIVDEMSFEEARAQRWKSTAQQCPPKSAPVAPLGKATPFDQAADDYRNNHNHNDINSMHHATRRTQRSLSRDVTLTTRGAFDAANAMFARSLGEHPSSCTIDPVDSGNVTMATKDAFAAINSMFHSSFGQASSMEPTMTISTKAAFDALNAAFTSGDGNNPADTVATEAGMFVRQDTGMGSIDVDAGSSFFDIREDALFIKTTAAQHNAEDGLLDIREDTVFLSETTDAGNDHHPAGLSIREDTIFINPSNLGHSNTSDAVRKATNVALADRKTMLLNRDASESINDDGTTRIINAHDKHCEARESDENTDPVAMVHDATSSGLMANFRDMQIGQNADTTARSSSDGGSTSQDENALPEFGLPCIVLREENDTNYHATRQTIAPCHHIPRNIHDPSVAASVLMPIDRVLCDPDADAEAALAMPLEDAPAHEHDGTGVPAGDGFHVYEDQDDVDQYKVMVASSIITDDMHTIGKDLLINPFAASFQHHMLSMLDPPVAEWPGVTLMSNDEEIAATKALKRMPSLFSLPATAHIALERCVGSGSYATVYHATLSAGINGSSSSSSVDVDVALKVESPPCPWEWYICKVISGRVASSHAASWFVNPSMLVLGPTTSMLAMPLGKFGSLQDLLNIYLPKGQRLDEVVVARLAVVLFQLMETLHGTARVLHNDIKPDNILVTVADTSSSTDENECPVSIGLQMIDFGRSIDVELLPPGAMLTGDGGTDAFRCVEMREGKPYLWQADTYAIAGVLHCLLFGEYMDVERIVETATGRSSLRIKSQFRRYWNVEMWSAVFDTLLNHYHPEEWCSVDASSIPPWNALVDCVHEWLGESSVAKREKVEMGKLLSRITLR